MPPITFNPSVGRQQVRSSEPGTTTTPTPSAAATPTIRAELNRDAFEAKRAGSSTAVSASETSGTADRLSQWRTNRDRLSKVETALSGFSTAPVIPNLAARGYELDKELGESPGTIGRAGYTPRELESLRSELLGARPPPPPRASREQLEEARTQLRQELYPPMEGPMVGQVYSTDQQAHLSDYLRQFGYNQSEPLPPNLLRLGEQRMQLDAPTLNADATSEFNRSVETRARELQRDHFQGQGLPEQLGRGLIETGIELAATALLGPVVGPAMLVAQAADAISSVNNPEGPSIEDFRRRARDQMLNELSPRERVRLQSGDHHQRGPNELRPEVDARIIDALIELGAHDGSRPSDDRLSAD